MAGSIDASLAQHLLEELRSLRAEVGSVRTAVAEEVGDIKVALGSLQASEAQQEKDLIKFWSDAWGPLKTDIQDIKNRIEALENKDVRSLEKRIDSIEKEQAVVNERIDKDLISQMQNRISDLEKINAKQKGLAIGLGLLGGVGGVSIDKLIQALFGAG